MELISTEKAENLKCWQPTSRDRVNLEVSFLEFKLLNRVYTTGSKLISICITTNKNSEQENTCKCKLK